MLILDMADMDETLFEIFVLGVLFTEDCYGYLLTKKVKYIVCMDEINLYPVIRKLQSEGYIETYIQHYQNRCRTYYRLTDEGYEKYREYLNEWEFYKNKFDKMLEGKFNHD